MTTLAEKDTTGTLTPGGGEVELLDRRTRTAKVFNLGGRRRRIGATIGPIHYRHDPFDEQEALKEIDIDVVFTPDEVWDAACETNGYQVRLWQSREVGGRTLRYIAQFRRAGRWLAMAPVLLLYQNDAGEKQVVSAVQAVGAPDIDNERNAVTWVGAFGEGIDFAYNLRPDRFFKTLIVREAAALPRPRIGTAGLCLVLVMALAWDAVPANGFAAERPPVEVSDDLTGIDTPDEVTQDVDFSFRDSLSRDVWWLRRPMAWDSTEEEPRTIGVDWSLRRIGDRVFATFAIPATALTKATYPVFLDVDIAEEVISTNSDDGRTQGAVHPGSTNLYLSSGTDFIGASTTLFYCVGMRFQTIPIPQGATIDSASVAVQPDRNSLYAIDLYIHAEDVDSGATWAAAHTPADGYGNRTTAKTRWTTAAAWTAGTWYQSPDIGAVVEEVVGRPGWALNADLNLLITNVAVTLPGTNMWRRFDTYEGGAGGKFNCSYTEAAAGGGNWLFACD